MSRSEVKTRSFLSVRVLCRHSVLSHVIPRFPADSLCCRLSHGRVFVTGPQSYNLRYPPPLTFCAPAYALVPLFLYFKGHFPYLMLRLDKSQEVGKRSNVLNYRRKGSRRLELGQGTVCHVTHSPPRTLATSRMSFPSSLCVPPFRPFSQKRIAV